MVYLELGMGWGERNHYCECLHGLSEADNRRKWVWFWHLNVQWKKKKGGGKSVYMTLGSWPTIGPSCTIWSVVIGNQLNRPGESCIIYDFLPSRTTESDGGSGFSKTLSYLTEGEKHVQVCPPSFSGLGFFFPRLWTTQRCQPQRRWRRTETGKRQSVTTGWRGRRKREFLSTSTRTELEARSVCVCVCVCVFVKRDKLCIFVCAFMSKMKINYQNQILLCVDGWVRACVCTHVCLRAWYICEYIYWC